MVVAKGGRRGSMGSWSVGVVSILQDEKALEMDGRVYENMSVLNVTEQYS